MPKKVTISDVAQYVGVSKSTISQYMNGNYNKMSQKTRDNIRHAIDTLNYSPSKQAQFLTTRKSNLIGVVVADISNMYSSHLLKGISTYFEETGYQIIIVESANSEEKEKEVLKKLIAQNVDGIIIQPTHSNKKQYELININQIPLVFVDREIEGSNIEAITTNNQQVVLKLMSEIISKKYKNVIVISQPILNINTRKTRYHTISSIAHSHNINVKLIEINDQEAIDISSIKKLISQEKSVIFALNGTILIEVLKLLNKHHIAIPNDVGVTGFDDLNIMDIISPGITSINQPTKLIGQTVAQYLDEILRKTDLINTDLKTTIESEIIWRNSL